MPPTVDRALAFITPFLCRIPLNLVKRHLQYAINFLFHILNRNLTDGWKLRSYFRLVVLLISKNYHNHYFILNEFNKGKVSELILSLLSLMDYRIQLAISNSGGPIEYWTLLFILISNISFFNYTYNSNAITESYVIM